MPLVSTTDTDEEVQAALVDPPAAPADGSTPPPAAAAPDDVDDDAVTDEAASDAARTLAARRNGKGSFQARIDQLAWKNGELQRQLEAERAARRASAPPDPGPAPKQEDFTDYDELEEAKRAHTARTVLAEQHTRETEAVETARRQVASDAAIAQFQERMALAKTEIPDFDQVVNQEIRISDEMRATIVESDIGPQLAYWFGSHPAEAANYAALSGPVALRALGRLEARLEAARTTGPTASATPRSSAPPPVKPVGGGATASRLPLDHPDVSFKEYEARRAAGER